MSKQFENEAAWEASFAGWLRRMDEAAEGTPCVRARGPGSGDCGDCPACNLWRWWDSLGHAERVMLHSGMIDHGFSWGPK